MNITIKYTQPIIMEGQVQNIKNHIIVCDDVATHPNGQPVATPAYADWDAIIKELNGSGVGASYPFGSSGSYERTA
jgi:hypothetical protein